MLINKIRNEKGNITTGTEEIQRIIRTGMERCLAQGIHRDDPN